MPISTTPSGDYYQQRADVQPAFTHDLFETFLTSSNLYRARRQVKANKGVYHYRAPSIKGMTIDALYGQSKAAGSDAKDNWSKEHSTFGGYPIISFME